MTGRTLSWTATTNGLDDAAFKGLGVTLDSTLNYTVYGDGDEKTADSSKTLYYHFVRQGGYILPEQYVKLAADAADRTAYSGSDAVFAIYKASKVTRNEKGELVLGENAKLSDRIGAFETSPGTARRRLLCGAHGDGSGLYQRQAGRPDDQNRRGVLSVSACDGDGRNGRKRGGSRVRGLQRAERRVYPRKDVLCAGRHARYKLQPFRGVYADRSERPHLHGED